MPIKENQKLLLAFLNNQFPAYRGILEVPEKELPKYHEVYSTIYKNIDLKYLCRLYCFKTLMHHYDDVFQEVLIQLWQTLPQLCHKIKQDGCLRVYGYIVLFLKAIVYQRCEKELAIQSKYRYYDKDCYFDSYHSVHTAAPGEQEIDDYYSMEEALKSISVVYKQLPHAEKVIVKGLSDGMYSFDVLKILRLIGGKKHIVKKNRLFYRRKLAIIKHKMLVGSNVSFARKMYNPTLFEAFQYANKECSAFYFNEEGRSYSSGGGGMQQSGFLIGIESMILAADQLGYKYAKVQTLSSEDYEKIVLKMVANGLPRLAAISRIKLAYDFLYDCMVIPFKISFFESYVRRQYDPPANSDSTALIKDFEIMNLGSSADWLTAAEVVRSFGYSRSYLTALANSGKVLTKRATSMPNKPVLFHYESIQNFLSTNTWHRKRLKAI